MHLLRLLRIFIPLLLVAAIVAGVVRRRHARAASCSARASRSTTTWTPLRSALDTRYASARDRRRRGASRCPGRCTSSSSQVDTAVRRLARPRVDTAAASRRRSRRERARSRSAARLVVAARPTPRLVGNTAALGRGRRATRRWRAADGRDAVRRRGDRFERERNRPAREPRGPHPRLRVDPDLRHVGIAA